MQSASDPVFMLKEALLSGLRAGRWGPGERLPPERHLGEAYSVPRSAVRRALQQLKDMGLVNQKVGSGTFVADDFVKRLPAPGAKASQVSPAELMEARLVLEPALVDLVVRNATAADLADLEECCRQAEQAQTIEQFEYWDGALHQRIANASHNTFLIQVFALIEEIRSGDEWGVLKKKSVTPERRNTYQVEHRRLVEALKMRDAEAAKRALLGHLDNVRRNLFDY